MLVSSCKREKTAQVCFLFIYIYILANTKCLNICDCETGCFFGNTLVIIVHKPLNLLFIYLFKVFDFLSTIQNLKILNLKKMAKVQKTYSCFSQTYVCTYIYIHVTL